ncbi:hypothetical protein ACFVYA_30180 [Amycolatopsis sp. NPDC058278]|uniref:hypothetical protein n=1 Tax=Amycolatopsis sp. NPDC058278 TaxID=3346417 RepID=UPI0036DC7085
MNRLADLDRVLDAVSHSRSAFEQYHALWTACLMLGSLEPRQRERIVEAVEEQLGATGRIKAGSQRHVLAQRILRALSVREDA